MSLEQNSSRWLRAPWRLAGATVLLILIALLWWSGTRESPLDQEITRRLAELRARGEPTDAQGLARLFPNPPPSEDAGELLTNILAFALHHGPPGASPIVNPSIPFGRTEPFPKPSTAKLRAYHEETKAIWEQWPQPWPAGMRYATHWERGMMSNSSANFIQVRTLTQMLATLAISAAEDNDPQRAADMLERGFWFARTIPSDSLVSHMIQRACAGLGVTAGERCLNRTRFTEGQVRQLAHALPPMDTNQFANALRAEHCLAIWAFHEIKAGRSLDYFYGSPRLPWWKAMVRKFLPRPGQYSDEDFLRYLALYHPSVEMMALPPLQAIAQSSNIMVQYQANVTTELAQGFPAHWAKALRAHYECEARLTALRTALAVERFRLAHAGKLPQSLAELVPVYLPAVPRDLFDKHPLRFQTLSPGYVIYSIGADGVDDGGLEKTNNAVRYDVTITVER